MKLAFELPEAQADRLREEAARLGLTPEDLARAALADLLGYSRHRVPGGRHQDPREKPGVVPAPRLMRYVSLGEIVHLHQALLDETGGATGIRDIGMLESALAQPRATFGGDDLHPTLFAKAAALGFSLALNHAFVDGNKRVAHAAMEVFLLLNGVELRGRQSTSKNG